MPSTPIMYYLALCYGSKRISTIEVLSSSSNKFSIVIRMTGLNTIHNHFRKLTYAIVLLFFRTHTKELSKRRYELPSLLLIMIKTTQLMP